MGKAIRVLNTLGRFSRAIHVLYTGLVGQSNLRKGRKQFAARFFFYDKYIDRYSETEKKRIVVVLYF